LQQVCENCDVGGETTIDVAVSAELAHLRLAIRASGLCSWTLTLGADDVSSAVATLTNVESFGYTSGEMPSDLGALLELLVVPEDRPRVLAELEQQLLGDAAGYESRYRVRHKDGAVRWILARGTVIRDEHRRPIAIVGTSVDVTRLEEAAQASKEAEAHAVRTVEQLKLATKLSGIDIWTVALGDDLVSSRDTAEGWGTRNYEAATVPPSDVLHGLTRVIVPEHLARVAEAAQALLDGSSDLFEQEYRVRTTDGAVKWRLGRAVIVPADDTAPRRMLGVTVDITRVKQVEEAATRAREQLQLATRLSGVSTWDHRLDGGDLAETFPLASVPADQPRVAAALQACIDGTSDRFDEEYRVAAEDGALTWRLGRGVVIRDDDGRPLRFSGTSIDITRVKAAEAEALATKTRLDEAMKLGGFTVVELDLRGLPDPEGAAVDGIGEWSERGLPHGTSVREFLQMVVVPDDLPRALEEFRLAIRNGSAQTELRMRDPSGAVRWRAVHLKCFPDEHLAPTRLISVSYDIQEIKAAEEEARRAIQEQRLATDLSGVGVWGYNLVDGELSTATSAFAVDGLIASLGYDPDEVGATEATRLSSLVYPEDRPVMEKLLDDYLTAGKTPQFEMECRFTHKDGSIVWRLVRGIARRNAAGVPLTFMGTGVDITQLKRTQEELQRVKDRLELAVLGSKAGIWDFEMADGDIGSAVPVWNNWWELFGYDGPPGGRNDLGVAIEYTLAPEHREPFVANLGGFMQGSERFWEGEFLAAHKDGKERWMLTRGVAIRDSLGRPIRLTGTTIDITDRKLAEHALRESEERFRGTFENAAVGMILTDLDGRFIEYNARFCEFLGYSRDELAGRRFVEFMVRDEVDDDLQRLREVIRGDLSGFTREKRYVRKDGAIVWGNITVSVLQRHTDGTPLHVMAILQDVTKRKELEVEIEKAQTRLELAIRGSDVAVYEGEFSGGSIETSSWKYFNMWEPMGIDPLDVPTDADGILGRSIHPDERHLLVEQFAAAIAAKQPSWYLEHRYLHNDGTVRWRLSRGTLIFDAAGNFTRLIGTETDITDLKRIEGELLRAREAAEAANRAKDEFLANVSHEIRTPMNAILGMTELALDSTPSEHQRQLLSTVRSAAKNLLTIINDLLDFSKIASGKLTLDRTDFSLRAAVGDTLRALAVRAHRKGLELICHVQPDVPDAVEGDVGRLRQVLMNLVGNAIKFTPQGEVEVTVTLDASTEREVALAFSVRDTGIGIAREKQATIFQAFEQEDSSTTRKYGGTGLGLTISAQLAALMNGTITVQSAPGCGSTFRFTARFSRSARPGTAALSPERLAGLKVLVVDDHAVNRRILVEWLTSWRMQPTSASHASEAMDLLEDAQRAGAPFSLVLLDARMPEMDGVALAGEIRRRWDSRGPRILLLSSDDNAEVSALARQNGVLAHLLKPVQQSEVLEAIWAVMNVDLEVSAPAGPAGARERSPALRVLVAEDNEFNITLLRALLSRRGHAAEFARDGHTALELARRQPFDLMLLDLHMPKLDGFEVVRAIREHERDTDRHLWVIALTARSSTRDRDRCIAVGMDEFLTKPIEAATLWTAIDRLTASRPRFVQAPRVPEQGLLDARAIRRACGGEPELLERVRVVFRKSMPAQMSRVRSALAAGDLRELREAAHQILATVGAFSTVTADVASTLEDAAIREESDVCAGLVERLGSLCDALLVATERLSIDSISL
jgi:two-component system sensor histidine kinase/response regulator